MDEKIETTEVSAVQRIGKVEFTVRMAEGQADNTARQRRSDAICRWLLAQWRLDRKGCGN